MPCGRVIITMATTLQVRIRQISASTSEATIRGHRVIIDRPASKGGTDAGPMGGELFLAGIGGCFMSNLLAAMKARGLEIPGLETEVTAELAGSPDRFETVELCVSADGADPEMLEKLVEIADRSCIMMHTLRDKLEIRTRIVAPRAIA
jgi:putative redox protein